VFMCSYYYRSLQPCTCFSLAAKSFCTRELNATLCHKGGRYEEVMHSERVWKLDPVRALGRTPKPAHDLRLPDLRPGSGLRPPAGALEDGDDRDAMLNSVQKRTLSRLLLGCHTVANTSAHRNADRIFTLDLDHGGDRSVARNLRRRRRASDGDRSTTFIYTPPREATPAGPATPGTETFGWHIAMPLAARPIRPIVPFRRRSPSGGREEEDASNLVPGGPSESTSYALARQRESELVGRSQSRRPSTCLVDEHTFHRAGSDGACFVRPSSSAVNPSTPHTWGDFSHLPFEGGLASGGERSMGAGSRDWALRRCHRQRTWTPSMMPMLRTHSE
jgi:hypothetical protein